MSYNSYSLNKMYLCIDVALYRCGIINPRLPMSQLLYTYRLWLCPISALATCQLSSYQIKSKIFIAPNQKIKNKHKITLMILLSSSLSLCVPTRKTEMAKSKSFSSVASSVWNKLSGHLSSISSLPAFRKKLKHHLFRSAFPGNPSPSTGITFCDVSPSTDATQVGHTPPPG